MKKFLKNIIKLKKISTIKDFLFGTFPSISGSGSGYTFYRPPCFVPFRYIRFAKLHSLPVFVYISFCFVPFRFVSVHFATFHFVLFRFVLVNFVTFHFVSFRFGIFRFAFYFAFYRYPFSYATFENR